MNEFVAGILVVHCWFPIPFSYAVLPNANGAGSIGKRTIWQFLTITSDPKPCVMCPLNLSY